MGSYSSLTAHAVFATKHRQPIIRKELRDPLYSYMGGILRRAKCKSLMIGGVEDHVHVLFGFPPTMDLSELLCEVKSGSSRWLNTEMLVNGGFRWQIGYGVFSISESHRSRVCRYIQNQEIHHKKRSFEDEYHALLRQHGFDPSHDQLLKKRKEG